MLSTVSVRLLLASALILASTEMPAADIQVAIVKVQERGALVREVLSEVIAPRRQIIAAEINGVISSHRLEMGMPVSKGQVVVEIESSEQQALFEIATQELTTARVDLAYRTKSFERAKINRNQNALSEAQFDEVQTELAKSRAHVTLTESRVKLQKTRLEKYRIKAPFDGELVRPTPVIGLYVRPGEPVFEIVDVGEQRIELKLTPEELSGLLEGNYALMCESNPMTLVAMSPVGEIKTGMTSLEARGCKRQLLPGQHVSINLVETSYADLPQQSILNDDDGEYVYVVEEKTVSRRDPRKLEVGESIIVLGTDKVSPGDVVTPINLDADS